jgi:cell division protein FtsI/penicillin-binding protein 2
MKIKFLTLGFLAIFLLVIARLFYWQIIKGKDLAKDALKQYEYNNTVLAPRGNILASDGSWLVSQTDAYLVYAELPKLTKTPREIANLMAPILNEDNGDRIAGLLSKKDVVWVAIKQKVTPEIKDSLTKLNIDGLGFQKVEDRFYTEASSSAQLLGFVGKDAQGEDTGYFGLEGYYDLTLSGKPGFSQSELDAQGNPLVIGDSREVSAIGGIDLLTHVDKSIQLMAEQKLQEGINKYEASGGSVIIMNPKSGAVMAMSSYPSYDPRTYYDFSTELFKNPAISFTFEPGSIFKIVVMASALDAGVVKPDTVCDVCAGPFKVDKYYIDTWNNKYNPNSTMEDVIVHSDNVGMAFVSQKMGADMLYDYLDKFGIGKLTGIDLQGEVTPKLRERGTWNVVDLATASFGQGIAVTPIQMTKAVSIIANGGFEVTPQVVASLKGDTWESDIKPKIGKRIVSDQAVKEITAMMVDAAKNGEAKWTYINGFNIAGKTGTAQIPIAGHYDATNTMASYIGFAPADDPKFVMLVILNEPKSSIWASETAAPLWYDIVRQLFVFLGVQPEN